MYQKQKVNYENFAKAPVEFPKGPPNSETKLLELWIEALGIIIDCNEVKLKVGRLEFFFTKLYLINGCRFSEFVDSCIYCIYQYIYYILQMHTVFSYIIFLVFFCVLMN